jgi:hypothetical protein
VSSRLKHLWLVNVHRMDTYHHHDDILNIPHHSLLPTCASVESREAVEEVDDDDSAEARGAGAAIPRSSASGLLSLCVLIVTRPSADNASHRWGTRRLPGQ